MPVLVTRPDVYPAPELTSELAEGFIVGVLLVFPNSTDEDLRRYLAVEWPDAFDEPKCCDVVETILSIMMGPTDRPLPLRDAVPGVLLGILRASPGKYVERHQLEDLIHSAYPAGAVPQRIDAAVDALGFGVVVVEKDNDQKRWRYWRRGRPGTV